MQNISHHIHRKTSIMMIAMAVIMLLASCATTKKEYKIPDPKNATVGDGSPFQDKLQFPIDDKGLDLNVNLFFDEEENILTLSLSGTRQLMVFRQDVFYGTVFKHPFLQPRTLEPKKLPYPVLVKPNMKITLAKNVWKGFNGKRNWHIFNNWLTGVSKEMKLIEPSTMTNETPEATLIVDSIVQRFSVDPKATKVAFTLRNLLVVDKDGMALATAQQKRTPSMKELYKIVSDNDLNITYLVNIQRNPCFDKDAEIEAAEAKVAEVRNAWTNLHNACPKGIVNSKQEQGIFNQHRSFLMSQFPAITDSTACTQLQDAYDRYNLYVDSIAKAPCLYVRALSDLEKNEKGGVVVGVSAGAILEAAHRIDNIVSQIVVSRDAAQTHDLTLTGRDIINNITKAAHKNGLSNQEQKEAYKVFLKAKKYFQTVIQGQWSN